MKWLLRIAIPLLILLIVLAIWIYSNVRDRHPDYHLDLNIHSSTPAKIKIGFAKVAITPQIIDTWYDHNQDARFSEADGDTFVDKNRNGKFDAHWIAGFHNARAANGVHDDLWARAMAFDDGETCVVLVVLDAIGFFHDDVVDIRKLIPDSAGIDYTIIASTHNHQAPDFLGVWGKSFFASGVDSDYLSFVKEQAVKVAIQAAQNRRYARLKIARDLNGARNLVNDSRLPLVFDTGLRLMQAIDVEKDSTLGILITWGDHPETLWSGNLLISSDFPHFLRDSMEKGIDNGGQLHTPGLGGTAIYVNGAIGGLMTTDPGLPVDDPLADTSFTAPSIDKIRAQGQQLAILAMQALNRDDVYTLEESNICLRAKTVELPLNNLFLAVAAMFGVLKRGFSGWMKIRSELAVLRMDEISFICIPGEIYPEIINGGIEAPPGQDFRISPVEIPAIRSQMPGQFRFVLGLANDEIGYIIPKSEWDEKSPYLYNAEESPYGEIFSLGPETAPLIHQELMIIIQDLIRNHNTNSGPAESPQLSKKALSGLLK